MENLREKVSSCVRVVLENGRTYAFITGSGDRVADGGWAGVLCNGFDPKIFFGDFDKNR